MGILSNLFNQVTYGPQFCELMQMAALRRPFCTQITHLGVFKLSSLCRDIIIQVSLNGLAEQVLMFCHLKTRH